MEKTLTRDELLLQLLQKAQNPFTTPQQMNDIKQVLLTSSNFQGKNHIYLLRCFFNEVEPLFLITEQGAIQQAYFALKENHPFSCYYLYKLLKDRDPVKARNYLRICVDYAYPEAYLEMAKCQHYGILFEQNRKSAFEYYKKAALCQRKEGYYGMLLMACEDGDTDLEEEIYKEAKKRGFLLPGIVE